MESQVKIIYKAIDELIPYINNPRDNVNAVDAVASSIKNFGFKVPIVIDKNNEIVAGHTRLKAAKKLGIEEVPCIVADDLSPASVKAYRLADNKVSELASWDSDTLALELEDLKLDFDMGEFGFFQTEEELVEEINENKSSASLDDKAVLVIDFETESELEQAFINLSEEGYNCRISIL